VPAVTVITTAFTKSARIRRTNRRLHGPVGPGPWQADPRGCGRWRRPFLLVTRLVSNAAGRGSYRL